MFNALFSHVMMYNMDVAEKADPPVGVVVATGLILVFSILVLLYLILLLEGRIFKSIDAKRAAKQAEADKAAEAAKPVPPPAPSQPPVQEAAVQVAEPPVVVAPPPAAVPAAPPVVEEGIPPEVVAAITAAVASIEDGRYSLSSVKMIPKGRGQWGLAGVIAHTEPF